MASTGRPARQDDDPLHQAPDGYAQRGKQRKDQPEQQISQQADHQLHHRPGSKAQIKIVHAQPAEENPQQSRRHPGFLPHWVIIGGRSGGAAHTGGRSRRQRSAARTAKSQSLPCGGTAGGAGGVAGGNGPPAPPAVGRGGRGRRVGVGLRRITGIRHRFQRRAAAPAKAGAILVAPSASHTIAHGVTGPFRAAIRARGLGIRLHLFRSGHNGGEIRRLQGRAADQAAVHIGLSQQLRRVTRIHGATVLDQRLIRCFGTVQAG